MGRESRERLPTRGAAVQGTRRGQSGSKALLFQSDLPGTFFLTSILYRATNAIKHILCLLSTYYIFLDTAVQCDSPTLKELTAGGRPMK